MYGTLNCQGWYDSSDSEGVTCKNSKWKLYTARLTIHLIKVYRKLYKTPALGSVEV